MQSSSFTPVPVATPSREGTIRREYDAVSLRRAARRGPVIPPRFRDQTGVDYGKRILFPATRVVRHPENLSAAQASGYMALLTGCFPMFEMARLQRGQAMLDGVGGALLERLGKVVLTV
jgi:hypothetical protein